jgi:hypothetical protein
MFLERKRTPPRPKSVLYSAHCSLHISPAGLYYVTRRAESVQRYLLKGKEVLKVLKQHRILAAAVPLTAGDALKA